MIKFGKIFTIWPKCEKIGQILNNWPIFVKINWPIFVKIFKLWPNFCQILTYMYNFQNFDKFWQCEPNLIKFLPHFQILATFLNFGQIYKFWPKKWLSLIKTCKNRKDSPWGTNPARAQNLTRIFQLQTHCDLKITDPKLWSTFFLFFIYVFLYLCISFFLSFFLYIRPRFATRILGEYKETKNVFIYVFLSFFFSFFLSLFIFAQDSRSESWANIKRLKMSLFMSFFLSLFIFAQDSRSESWANIKRLKMSLFMSFFLSLYSPKIHVANLGQI